MGENKTCPKRFERYRIEKKQSVLVAAKTLFDSSKAQKQRALCYALPTF